MLSFFGSWRYIGTVRTKNIWTRDGSKNGDVTVFWWSLYRRGKSRRAKFGASGHGTGTGRTQQEWQAFFSPKAASLACQVNVWLDGGALPDELLQEEDPERLGAKLYSIDGGKGQIQ